MRILIVDDEAMMLEEMQCIVQGIKPEAEIVCAKDYRKALEAARECSFEVFYEGTPVQFPRSLAKELLAYLVDLRGASANTAELCEVLWEDSVKAQKNRHYFCNIVAELKKVLKACGAEKVFICERNLFAIDVNQVDCDYYRFLEGDVAAVNSYHGEYMRQYSWAEMTLGALEKKMD